MCIFRTVSMSYSNYIKIKGNWVGASKPIDMKLPNDKLSNPLYIIEYEEIYQILQWTDIL